MSEWLPATAVITGGASGIGLAIAKELKERGARLLLADLPGGKLEQAGSELGVQTFACDVGKIEEVEALARTSFERLGTVELLINNAGVGGPHGKMWEVDPEDARKHFDINFWGIWNGCRAFAPRMIDQEARSAIYNTGSENSFFCAVPQTAAYIAAKHAVLGLTESLREDLAEHVHAGLIVPGWVFTPLGDERVMRHGMDVGEYAAIVVPQLLARQRFVVSHYSNVARIGERMDELAASYEASAYRDVGDKTFDVRTVLAKRLER